MPSRVDQVAELTDRMRELSRSSDLERVREELHRILASDQFRASHRSCAFLEYVVEQAIHGSFDALKERVLGVELFGRDPLFDTDRDSVVRVAANDVRKRLREYYRGAPQSSIRIGLPPGLYIPQIELDPKPPENLITVSPRPKLRRLAAILLSILLAAGIAAAAYVGIYRRQTSVHPSTEVAGLPWSALLRGGEPINIVLADANLVAPEVRAGRLMPIETYAEHRFDYGAGISGPFGAFVSHVPLTSVSDAILASRIAALAGAAGGRVRLRYCNRFQLSELKSDEPVVFFGSPISDPWVALLYDQLNFQVVHQFDSGNDVITNRQPKAGEPAVYVPGGTAQGLSKGYALIALVPNLAGTAPVLIIAGTSSEGTQAAGEFVTNPDRLSSALKKFGIGPRARYRHLELVIKTAYIFASSARSEVVAYRAQ